MNLNEIQVKKSIDYIEDVLENWTMWQTHHYNLTQAMRDILSFVKELTTQNVQLRCDTKRLNKENEELRSIIDEAIENSKEHCKMLKQITSEAKKFKSNILLTLFNELNSELLKVARCQKADEPNMRSQEVFDILDHTVKRMMEGE